MMNNSSTIATISGINAILLNYYNNPSFFKTSNGLQLLALQDMTCNVAMKYIIWGGGGGYCKLYKNNELILSCENLYLENTTLQTTLSITSGDIITITGGNQHENHAKAWGITFTLLSVDG